MQEANVLTRPLREQLREKVQRHQERQAKVAPAGMAGMNRRLSPMQDVAEDGCDAAPPREESSTAYAPGGASQLPAGSLMPRVGELEDANQRVHNRLDAHERRMTQLEEGQVETDSNLATAIARLAKIVGVDPSAIGL